MASEKDATCENDPNFAIICAFFQKFSTMLNIQHPDIQLLKEWLENTDEVSPGLKELHIKLLRKLRKTVHETAWETALAKFCYMYSSQDAWEIERFGYKKSSLKVKLRILKELLEYQFERNGKFRNNFSALTADELRSEPIGRDKLGHSYWLTQDRHCNLRIYQEHLDEEIWQVVATNREELVTLITRLRGNEVVLPSIVSVVDEDSSSNSCTAAVVKPPPPEEQEDDESQEEKANETEGKIPNIKIKLDTNEIVITENGAAEREAYSDSESDYRGEEDGDLYDHESEQIVEEKSKDDDDNKEEVNEEKKEDPVVCNEQVNGETKASDVQKNVEAKAPNEQTNGETNGSAEKTKISETIEPEHRNGYVEDVETERKVKPIVISQAKISSEKSSKKRILEDSDKAVEEENLSKKSRPTLLGNNREKKKSKYEKFNDESDDEDDEDDEGEEGEEENTEDEEGAAEEEQEEGEEEELGEEEEDEEEEEEEEEPGEEIEEEVMVIKCDGNGKECESSYLDFLKFDNVDIEGSVGEAIEEEVMFIVGEGSGKDCLVGNDKDNNEKQDICCNEADSKTESGNRKKDCPLAIEKEVEVTNTKSNISSDIQPNETDKAISEIDSLEELTNGEKLSKPRVNLRKRKGDVTEANSDNIENSFINESSSASRIERSPPAIRILEKRPSPSPCPKTESAKFEVPKIEVTEVNENIEKNATNIITEQQHEEDKLKIPDVPKDCELLPNTDIKPTISNETELKSKDSTGVQQNRKRRLDKESSRHNSESETDLNSEIIEEHTEEDVDIGGKRPKMRCKVINSNIRKKIEAERKDVIKESSSSGSEEEISTKDIIRKSPTESVDKIVEDVDGKTSDKIEKLKEVVCNIPVDLEVEEEEEETLDSEKGEKSITETLPIEILEKERKETMSTEILKKVKIMSTDIPEKIKTVSTETPQKVKTVSTETPEEVKIVSNATSERGKTVSTAPTEKVKIVSTTTTDKFKTLSTEISEKIKTVCTETTEKVKTVSTATPEKVKIVSTVKPEKEIIELLTTEKSEEVKALSTETTGSVDIEKSIKSLGETVENIISIKDDVSIVEKSPEREVILLQIQTRSGRKNPIVFPKLPTSNRRRTKTLNVSGLKNAPMGKKAKTDEKEDSTTTDNIKEDLNKVTDPCRNDVDKVEDTENSITIEPSDPENSSPPEESPKITGTTENSNSDSLSPVEDKKLSPDNTTKDAVKRKQRQQLEIDVSNIIDAEAEGIPVRQSRRIAQLKIREEAERRKLEEIALKKMKAELKKKKKEEQKNTKDEIENENGNENENEIESVIEHEKSESSDKNESIDSEVEMKKKVEKKRRGLKKGGWSSGTEDEPEEEEEEFQYETDVGSPLFRSDHEFSPESDIEDESQIVPMKRARTARREGEEGTDVEDGSDESCQKCGKSDHPEWILLCDKCDKGYHCSCLSPVLFIIPEGDWFCPPCQQEQLIIALEIHLKEFDDLIIKRKEEEELRVQNLELAKLALEKQAKVISAGKQPRTKPGRRSRKLSSNYRGGSNSRGLNDDDSSRSERTSTKSSDSSSGSSSSSSSTRSSASDSDDEPIYKLRKRRQINVSYQFHEYDDLINSAIKEEMDEVAGAGNLGRGKDISTIIEADKEEKLRLKQLEAQRELQDSEDAAKAKIVAGDFKNTDVKKEEEVVPPVKDENKANEDSGSDFEPFKPRPKLSSRRNIKKKNRKLNSLDISSEDDGSDEDFKTSSYETEEEDESISAASESDSSLEIYKHKSKKNKKNSRRSTRRAARQRRKRYDDDFIVEDSDCSVVFPKIKKKRRDDTDYTESEDMSEDLDSEDLCEDSTDSDSDGAWRPSKRKKQRTSVKKNQPKKKSFSKQKKHKRTNNEKSFKTGMSKNRIRDYDDENSMDSGRRTRGKRFTYLEDYEDESSDDGIKPGVKRPDTPPEEREKFIRRQEEIKRMLAEKNTEAAKVAATPTLIPISRPNKPQASLDPSTSLSTVPLSVIKSAKALDIDYLQRKGELESDDPDTDFDDDLPEDFNPEDMDEEEIAKMMEEEDFAQQQLKLAGEAIRQKKLRETDSSSKPEGDIFRIQRATPAPIYDTTRKRFPIPTPHPPLRNPSYYQMPHSNPTFSRGGVPPNRYLPQQSGRPLLPPPLQTNSPSVHSNLLVHTNTSLSSSHTVQAISPVPNTQISTVLSQVSPQGEPLKPRGRRKKITPLRDTLQKQQAAAAAAAAAAASCVVGQPSQGKEDTSPGRDKPAGGNLSVAQPPQLYKPSNNAQPSVITRMAQPARPRFSDQGPRFFGPLNQMGQRPPPTIRPMSVPAPHHPMRPSYAAGPPPLRPANNRPPPPVSLGNGISRHPLPPRPPLPFNGPEQFSLRPRTAPALNPYRPPLYGTPGFPPAPPGHSSPQGPPPQAPNSLHSADTSYTAPSFTAAPFGSYYPPPIGTTHSTPPPPTATAVPSSVIVSATANTSPPPVSAVAEPIIQPSPPIPPRPKATPLETFDSKSTPPPEPESVRSPYSSSAPADGNDEEDDVPRNSTSEFSGLVSYFSSQQDDLNT